MLLGEEARVIMWLIPALLFGVIITLWFGILIVGCTQCGCCYGLKLACTKSVQCVWVAIYLGAFGLLVTYMYLRVYRYALGSSSDSGGGWNFFPFSFLSMGAAI